MINSNMKHLVCEQLHINSSMKYRYLVCEQLHINVSIKYRYLVCGAIGAKIIRDLKAGVEIIF